MIAHGNMQTAGSSRLSTDRVRMLWAGKMPSSVPIFPCDGRNGGAGPEDIVVVAAANHGGETGERRRRGRDGDLGGVECRLRGQ
jgi:hypothetical protein